jgi:hypothetical protein
MDNDRNGAVDDADVEGDGVCDCLKIASIGGGGASSSGALAFKDWPNPRRQNPVIPLNDQTITDALLEPFDVIVVLNVATTPVSGDPNRPIRAAFTADEVASFQRWVRAGGGAITTMGYSAEEGREVVNVNRLLAPFGMGYSTANVSLDGNVETSRIPSPKACRRSTPRTGWSPTTRKARRSRATPRVASRSRHPTGRASASWSGGTSGSPMPRSGRRAKTNRSSASGSTCWRG